MSDGTGVSGRSGAALGAGLGPAARLRGKRLMIYLKPGESGARLVDRSAHRQYWLNEARVDALARTQAPKGTLPGGSRAWSLWRNERATRRELRRLGLLRVVEDEGVGLAVQSTPLARLFVEVTNRCNLHCAHCYGSFGAGSHTDLEPEALQPLVSDAVRCGLEHLDFTGGEPMMNPRFPEFLELADSLSLRTTVFTNLTARSDALVSSVLAYRVERVITSLESTNPAVHDEFRGRAGAFADTMVAMRHLQDLGVPVTVNVVVGRHNEDDVIRSVGELRERGFAVHVDFMLSEGRASSRLMASSGGRARLMKWLIEQESPNAEHAGHMRPGCGVAESFVFVTSGGRIVLCPSLRSTAFEVASLDAAPRFEEVAARTCGLLSRIACREKCPVGAYCRGGCRARALANYGTIAGCDQDVREAMEVLNAR